MPHVNHNKSTMSDKRAASQSSGDAGMGVVEADPQRMPISGRTGAMVMRSVSIFLASGRKVSVASRRQQSDSSCALGSTATGAADRRGSSRRDSRACKLIMPGEKNLAKGAAAHQAKLIESLRRKTKFSRQELDALCKIYSKLIANIGSRRDLSTNNGIASFLQNTEGIDRSIFRELLHNTFDLLTEEILVERMFSCWDRDSEGTIRLEPWILGLDVFLRGNIREKIEFCFRVYDLNGDGFITKDEIFLLFKNCLMKQPGEEDPEEGIRDLSEMTLKKLDIDHDGKVSFFDYEMTVRQEPLLLEAFGQVLPTPESAQAFLLTLKST
ncbi:unnamed protein product [Trichogramma brassicae]|uniref:EF-hand domain-containing protein n=2 Tax=Trichogramma TaxID=7490 RepID=A0A6H5IFF2_9HYME|nr:unnamed protein product [Trichogramma brassicae]